MAGPPDFHRLTVSRHARVAVVGDPATAREAWLILHGHGMLARGILHWFRAAATPSRLLIAPEALSRFYSDLSGGKRVVGASWVTREDLDDDLVDTMTYLDQAVDELIAPSLPLQVHGFSQGVAIGARWSVHTSRQVSRLVGWAGAFPDDVTADRIRNSNLTQPIHLIVGDQDGRVPPERVEADATRLRSEGVAVTLHRFAGGHHVDESLLNSLSSIPAPT